MNSIDPTSHEVEKVPLPAERGAFLACLPLFATGLFYTFPSQWQQNLFVQFFPQSLAYLGFVLWASQNRNIPERLGLSSHLLAQGLQWGVLTGLALGSLNAVVILRLAPALGLDIRFLLETPHAKIPLAIMVPWFILFIALFVELNFRGFQLGRLLVLGQRATPTAVRWVAPVCAIAISAVAFAFDPFLVATFKHLHWIAICDGLVWGVMWIRLRNLYATVVAHAVEVILMYLVVRAALH